MLTRVTTRHQRQRLKWELFVLLALPVISACSAIQPAETGGPRATQPVYPVVVNEDPSRLEATMTAIARVVAPGANQTLDVNLHPVTGTILSLPSLPAQPLYLPKVGDRPEMNEEETRESLRRFITTWSNIIGSEPDELTLLEHVTQPDGTRQVTYEQSPFRYPLRGEFGKLQIRFGADRRLTYIRSTCIPDADRHQQGLAAITPVLKPEDAVKYIEDKGASYRDASGQVRTLQPAADSVNARELVYYAMQSSGQSNSLEIHLAWEIELKDAPVKFVYLDAVSSQVLGTNTAMVR